MAVITQCNEKEKIILLSKGIRITVSLYILQECNFWFHNGFVTLHEENVLEILV